MNALTSFQIPPQFSLNKPSDIDFSNPDYIVSDEHLAEISKLTQITSLKLSKGPYTLKGLYALRALPNLKQVEMSCLTSDQEAKHRFLSSILPMAKVLYHVGSCIEFVKKQRFHHLNLSNPNYMVSNEDLEKISKLTQITFLKLFKGPYTLNGLHYLRDLPNLKQVEMSRLTSNWEEKHRFLSSELNVKVAYSTYDPVDFCIPGIRYSCSAPLAVRESTNLPMSKVLYDVKSYMKYAERYRLREIDLSDPEYVIDDRILEQISKFIWIVSLKFFNGSFTLDGFSCLKALPHLKQVEMSYYTRNRVEIRNLLLKHGVKIKYFDHDKEQAYIDHVKAHRISEVDFSPYKYVSDEILEQIAELPRITSLKIPRGIYSSIGFSKLRNLVNLTSIGIAYHQIQLLEIHRILVTMPSLTVVKYLDTSFVKATVAIDYQRQIKQLFVSVEGIRDALILNGENQNFFEAPLVF